MVCALFVSFSVMTSVLCSSVNHSHFRLCRFFFLLACQIVCNHMCRVAPREDECLLNRSHVCFSSETLVADSPFNCPLSKRPAFSLLHYSLNLSPINHVIRSLGRLPDLRLSRGAWFGNHAVETLLLILTYNKTAGVT